MTKSQLVKDMLSALDNHEYLVYYQPQYDHSNAYMVGAEALVRWDHPQQGILGPYDFVPQFEDIGQIDRLDAYVYEEVCRYLSTRLSAGKYVVPISVNCSRQDIFHSDFVDRLEDIRKRYDVPARYLRIEITESAAVDGSFIVADFVEKLHRLGYVVEMDDFGSGYSSLNVLKDIEFDVVKLDMKFFEGTIGGRGGVIIASVVQMCQGIGATVVAEGVETVEQADFMRSVGSNYVQGYLYSKPVPEQAFDQLLEQTTIAPMRPMELSYTTLESSGFSNPESQESLIFNRFVGPAAILMYGDDGSLRHAKINSRFIQELDVAFSEEEFLSLDPWTFFDEENRAVYQAALDKAVEKGEDTSCDTWCTVCSDLCGDAKVYLRSEFQLLGRFGNAYQFFASIRNFTLDRLSYEAVEESERKFRNASEQANVYAWEYDIPTKIMRPCVRCMRDLELPKILNNYPESAIEAGIFPPDYADMYRDMMRRVDEGESNLEAVIPLTADRIPFIVRYTVERDKHGRPVKAYGSATLVVDPQE
ncbi:MAG: EAL domain-containing protein [Coriobacteriia bacterium]|nr:EAL domain-containing protein [Coriobacteriia bacterium]